MKAMLIFLSITMLLTGLPLLHGFLVLSSIEEFLQVPSARSFFYLFTFPAWAVAIMVFVVETYRSSFIPSKKRIGSRLMLALMGMIMPTIGLALSPVGTDISLSAYAGVSTLGLLVGLLGAVLFNFTTNRINKMTGS